MATALALDTTVEVTLTVANQLYEVTIPANARSVTIQPRTNNAKIVITGGTDGAAIGATDYIDQPGNTSATYPTPGSIGMARAPSSGTRKMWLASASAGTVAEVTAWRAPYTSGG